MRIEVIEVVEQADESSFNATRAIAFSLLDSLDELEPFTPQDSTAEVCSVSYLKWMAVQINQGKDWDLGKANRWIGYIQGVMVAGGLTTVNQERNRVRGLLEAAKDIDEIGWEDEVGNY